MFEDSFKYKYLAIVHRSFSFLISEKQEK